VDTRNILADVARLAIWEGLDDWRTEIASVDIGSDGVRARGTQVGLEPIAYRLDYELDAGDGWVTRRLQVEVSGNGWSRDLALSRLADSSWRCVAQTNGDAPLPIAGGESDRLVGAIDCDLGLSPLTNLMPVRRHELHRRAGHADILVAWVSVPDLGVHASRQRYEHVRATDTGAAVRFIDLGLHKGFVADLEVDRDALVVHYPGLARRVESKP
jgi:hypothetical protein